MASFNSPKVWDLPFPLFFPAEATVREAKISKFLSCIFLYILSQAVKIISFYTVAFVQIFVLKTKHFFICM